MSIDVLGGWARINGEVQLLCSNRVTTVDSEESGGSRGTITVESIGEDRDPRRHGTWARSRLWRHRSTSIVGTGNILYRSGRYERYGIGTVVEAVTLVMK